MKKDSTFFEQGKQKRTARQAAPSRPRTRSAHLSCALLLALVMILGMGKGWAQCTPSGNTGGNKATGDTLQYNNCGASSVTFSPNANNAEDYNCLWSPNEPPVAYCADFGGNFTLSAGNTKNLTYENITGGAKIKSSNGDAQIKMYNLGSFDPHVYKYFIIHYQVKEGNPGQMQIFFLKGSDDAGISEANSLILSSGINNTNSRTVVIDASSQVGDAWETGGNITGWRLDPCTNSNCIIVFDYIALTSVYPGDVHNPTTYPSTPPQGQPANYYNNLFYNATVLANGHSAAGCMTGDGNDYFGYSSRKTISGSNLTPGTTWYSDRIKSGWSCNSSSIKHVFCGFNAGSITSGSNTICYGSTTALPQITSASQADGNPPAYKWQHTYNGSTNDIIVDEPSYQPVVTSYNTQPGEHVFTRWAENSGTWVQSTGEYTLTVRPQVTVSLSSNATQTVTYGDAINAITVTQSPSDASVSTSLSWLSYSSSTGKITGTPPAATSYPYTVSATVGNCPAVTATGTITVKKRTVTVSVQDATKEYNGSEQSGNTNYTFDNVVSGHTATITYTPAKGTNASTTPYNNGSFTASTFKVMNGSTDVTANYTLGTQTKGKLTINKKNLTITAKAQEYTYNGSAQGENNQTYTSNISNKVTVSGLVSGQSLTSITLNGRETNAGTYSSKIVPSAAAISGGAGNYNITYTAGQLKINPKAVTITAKPQTYTYTGQAQGENNATYTSNIASKVEVSGLVSGQSLTSIKLNGRETNAGTYNGKIVPSAAAVGGNTGNYSFTYNAGTLTIDKASITIKANDATKVYDNNSNNPASYTATVQNKPTNGVNPTYTVTRAVGENVGTYAITVNAPAASNPNYNITVQPGTFTITKASMAITVNGSNTSKVYNGTSQSYTGTVTPTSSTAGFDATKFNYSGTKTVSGTNVGDYTAAINTSQCSYNNDNYQVSWTQGTPVKMTITPANINLTCPSGAQLTKVYDGSALAPAATATGVVSSDNITIEYSTDNGQHWSTTVASITQVGTQAVQVRATHANYNTATCDYTLEITQPNVIITGTLPALTVTGCTAADAPAYTTVAALEAALQGTGAGITNYCGTLSVSHTDGTPTGTCAKTFKRTYTVSNGCTGSEPATVEQTITLNIADNITITGGTNAGTVECESAIVAPHTITPSVMPTVTDACGNVLTYKVSNGSPVITVGGTYTNCQGTKTYTYTYEDCAGHSRTWTYTYTIEHINAPSEFGGPVESSKNVNCVSLATAPTTLPVIKDVCGTVLNPTQESPTVADSWVTGKENCKGTRTYTYTYEDCAGKIATWTYIYNIEDNVVPEISGTMTGETASGCVKTDAPAPMNTLAYLTSKGLTISDNCTDNADLVVTSTDGELSGTCVKTFTRTYTVTDACGNSSTAEQTITLNIVDNITITGGTNAGTVGCASAIVAPHTISPSVMPTVTDACGTVLTYKMSDGAPVIEEGGTYTSCEGTKTYTYTYEDCAGHSETWTFTYTIEAEDFTITEANGSSTVHCVSAATEPSHPTVNDACGNAITNVTGPVVTDSPSTLTCEGTRTYTWTYTDCSGKYSHDWSYTYTILPPVLTFTNDGTLVNIQNVNACYSTDLALQLRTDAQVKAMYSSNCDHTITVTHNDEQTLTSDCGWKITRTFTITDGCNTETKVQTVSGKDQSAPTFTAPAAATVCRTSADSYDDVVLPAVTGEPTNLDDNCTAVGDLVVDHHDVPSVDAATGVVTITRTWSVTDLCNNEQTADQIITVNPLPTISAAPASQEITYGDDITPVVITNTTSSVTLSTLPAGLSYNISTQTIYSTPGTHIAAGNYTITATATSGYGCGTAVQEIQINVKKKNLTISLDSSKVYDGTPLVVTCAQVHYSGLVDGDVFTSGTITTDGFVAGDYYCTDNQFNRMWADYTATQSGFGPASVTHNYAPTFNVVLRITSLPLALTANSATKVYDGTPLTDNGFIVNSTLGTGDAVSATVNGSQTCLGEADNVIDAATVQVMHDNGDGTTTDVTSSYSPVTLNDGLLKVTPVTSGFVCPAAITITLTEGKFDTIVPQSLLGTPSHDLMTAGHAHATNNLDAVNPMTEGDHTVIWTLLDDCDSAMITCTQVVTVEYAPCSGTVIVGGYDYPIKRIGYQCWFTENLQLATGDHKAYGENASNVDKFGYLYTWYTAVGVPEGTTTEVPAFHDADDGTQYIQGICPDGWSVGSTDDYDALNLYAGGTAALKDPSAQYWQLGYEGENPGTGFNARGGGWYNSTLHRYEDIMTGYHFWKADAPGVETLTTSTTVEACLISYWCDHILYKSSSKYDRRSVRCVRKEVLP